MPGSAMAPCTVPWVGMVLCQQVLGHLKGAVYAVRVPYPLLIPYFYTDSPLYLFLIIFLTCNHFFFSLLQCILFASLFFLFIFCFVCFCVLVSVRDGLPPMLKGRKTWAQRPKVDNFGEVQNKKNTATFSWYAFPAITLVASSNLQIRDVSKHFLQKNCSQNSPSLVIHNGACYIISPNK